MRKLLLVVVALSSLSSLAQGQSQNKKPTEIIFGDGDTIDGDLSKPDVEFVRTAPGAKFDKLIRVREDFKVKVMESVRELLIKTASASLRGSRARAGSAPPPAPPGRAAWGDRAPAGGPPTPPPSPA